MGKFVEAGARIDDEVVLPRFILGSGSLPALVRRWPPTRERAAFALLDAALEAGCNAVDTALVYGNGHSERLVGSWIRSRRVRDAVLIVGKGGHPDAACESRVHPGFVAADLERSLRNLGVERIDLYLLHRDDPRVPVGVIMAGLHRLVQAGKVRALGASNWSHLRIEAANQYAFAHGLTPFSVSSPHYSLAEMHEAPWPGCSSITGEAGAEGRAWYEATRLPVLAWSPLAGGFLTDHGTTDEAQRRAYEGPANVARRDRLVALARERGVSAAQLALAYLLQQPLDVYPIVAARSPSRLGELLQAARIQLSAEDLSWLDTGTRNPAESRSANEEWPSPS